MNNKNVIKAIKYIAILAVSFVTMLAMASVSGFGITGIDIVLPCLFALCVIVYSKAYGLLRDESMIQCRKDLKFAIPIGVVAAVATVIGSKIDMDSRVFEPVGIKDFAYIIFLIPFFISILVLLFFSSDVISKKIVENDVKTNIENGSAKKGGLIRRVFCYAIIMFACWLPYYFTYCPGGIGNDLFECVKMVQKAIPWTNHHPVLFTAILKLYMTAFATDGNVTRALAAMVLFQMIVMAIVMSLCVAWLEIRGLSKAWKYVTIAFMSLYPIFPMYSIYLTKDIMFALVVVLLVLFLIDFSGFYSRYITLQDENKIAVKYYLVLGILLFLCMITRNNGTLVAILTILVLIAGMRKIWKQLLVVFISILVLNGIYKGLIWSAIGIEKQSFVESAAIPLTQIAYTIYTDGIIEGEDREYLESIMPFDKVKANYLPGYVDSYKFDDNFNTEIVDANPGQLIKVWFHLLPDNFGRYVEGYLIETCGYWHYGESNTLCTEGVQPNKLGIYGTDYIEKLTGISLSGIIPKLMLIVRKLPVMCMLSQMAIEILAVMLVACQYVRRKNSLAMVAMVPLMAIWISVMIASPAHCLFRYMCPVFFLWPVLIYVFWVDNER